MDNYRKNVLDALLPYFRRDHRYYLLVGDMGFASIDKLRSEFPDRVINCGVMEQGTTGITAGMSMSGLIPIFYTIVNFIAFRAIEQVRNDIVLQGLNVKLIGTGANNHFEFLGHSHCCDQDDVKIMKLINMKVYDPYYDGKPFNEIIDEWITDNKAGYLRV
ncbi:MAG: transketolase [Deltaproteobacteria bacterium]|jgi:transketolase|nr:MAG: transketolase [Deltaproteobacteria bacterium]